MTNEELDAIEARANAASEGPWTAEYDGAILPADSHPPVIYSDGDMTDADREFVAAARDDVPKLVAEVRRLRGLFTEADAERLQGAESMSIAFPDGTGGEKRHNFAGVFCRVTDLHDLARRIREARGEP